MDDRRTTVGLLLWWAVAVCVQGVAADTHHYNANGVICGKCPPGTAVLEHCTTNFANSTCQPCPDHYFMDKYNANTHCTLCKNSCPKDGQEVQACTPTTNLVCRCNDGFHRYPVDRFDPHFKCRSHTPCKAGYGEVSYGNHSHDTMCEECKVGQHFVDKSDPDHPRCEACSVCPSNRSVLSNCTLMNDAVCSENTEITTTPQTPLDEDSSGLSGGAIAGIVIVCIILLAVVIAIGIICYRRQQNTPEDEERPESAEQNGNAQVEMPLLDWSGHFIEHTVFPFLTKQLGGEWQHFIRQLPGWPETTSVTTVIEHKLQEEILVPDRIMGCLMKWKREADQEMVCKDSIMSTLIEVNRTDLERKLQKLPKSSSVTEKSGP